MASPDYTKYSLEALLDAYNNIDKEAFPERVGIIEKEIEKRGKVQPQTPDETKSSWESKPTHSGEKSTKPKIPDAQLKLKDGFYRNSLITIMVLFILINGINFIATQGILLLVALIIQIPFLILVLLRIKRHVTFIKIWTFLLIFGGGAGLVASCSTFVNKNLGGNSETLHTLSSTYLLDSMFRFILGIIYLKFLNSNVEVQTTESSSETA